MSRDDESIVGADLGRAAALLREGGLVAFGTETVYGLGADATDERAVARIFEAKKRPRFDPLIVHVATKQAAQDIAAVWPIAAENLANAFWPGPLTLVLTKRSIVKDLATSGLPSVGIRVPGHPQSRALLEATGLPIAAPSANPFGMVSPTTAQHVFDQLRSVVDYIFDTGPCDVGVESSVVRVDDDKVTLLRPGGVTLEQLRAVVPQIVVGGDDEKAEMNAPDSPGQLPQHYSPGVEVRLGRPATSSSNDGLLAFGREVNSWRGPVEVLSEIGDCVEAAANLFSGLRRLAATGVGTIYVDDIPTEGIGAAINDRLQRAANS